VIKYLVAARVNSGGALLYEVSDASVHDVETSAPRIRFQHEGGRREKVCLDMAGTPV